MPTTRRSGSGSARWADWSITFRRCCIRRASRGGCRAAASRPTIPARSSGGRSRKRCAAQGSTACGSGRGCRHFATMRSTGARSTRQTSARRSTPRTRPARMDGCCGIRAIVTIPLRCRADRCAAVRAGAGRRARGARRGTGDGSGSGIGIGIGTGTGTGIGIGIGIGTGTGTGIGIGTGTGIGIGIGDGIGIGTGDCDCDCDCDGHGAATSGRRDRCGDRGRNRRRPSCRRGRRDRRRGRRAGTRGARLAGDG
ncbi:hypothetical protein BCEP27_30207 [Burkholderia cepacia]